jgi:VCBS repeat protein
MKRGGTMTCRNNKLFSTLLFASGVFLLYPLAQARSSPIIFIWNGTEYARVYPFTNQNRANTQRVQCFVFDQASQKYVCQNGGQPITVPLTGYFCTTVDIVADTPSPPPPPPTTYGYCLGQPTNTHDFDDNMVSDIAWRDTSGNTAIWLMNGTVILNQNSSFVGNVAGQWAVVGQRDFNGDGYADLLWHDTRGNVAIWEMSGTTILNSNNTFVANVPTNWSVVGTGDFNGDGMGDILWQDASGNVAIWEMSGTTVLNQNSSFVANVPGQW